MKRWSCQPAWYIACVLVSICACSELPPESQILVRVDTDAPLPPGPGELTSSDDPPALFDRMRFEVFRPGEDTACDKCTSDFAVTSGQLEGEGVSIGIVPIPGQAGYRLRVRLYREEFKEIDEPSFRTTLHATVALPVVAEHQTTEVHVFLPAESVGRERGTLDAPIAAGKGSGGPSRVGSWLGAKRVDCGEAAAEGEACVPGGAFWMGHPNVAGGIMRDDDPTPRLVVVSPFYLGTTEVTVRDFRRWFVERYGSEAPADDPTRRPAVTEFTVATVNYCSLPEDLTDESSDSMPLNCLGYERAREYCEARGASLPSEAQLEYASGALESRLYVWGRDEPTCEDAVFARAPDLGEFKQFPGDCRSDSRGGLHGAVHGARDVLTLRGTPVFALAGNLAELARDAWDGQAEQGGCWAPPLLFDPLCERGEAELHVTKGGSWGSEPHELRAAYRAGVPNSFGAPSPGNVLTHLGPFVGFRCARPALAGIPR
jgi:formylglycine-generating enzyme required for sulfatase activity